MKKRVFGKQLKRDANERKALFKNLLTSLVIHERIKTTEAKAKAIKADADKLITKAKKAEAGRALLHPLVNGDAVDKLIKDLGPRFAKKQGGYTRIIRVGRRRVADNAQMVYIEWTERPAGANLEHKTENLKNQGKKKEKTKAVKTDKKTTKVKTESKTVKPVVAKKEDKAQKPGFLKQLVTRQKKGQ